jgi:myo-inositol-1(or 4)-monophosphatase
MLPALVELRELVRTAAREELLPRFSVVQHHIKHDGSLLTEADLAMQQRLRRELTARWPQYDFLGEEMHGDEHELLTAVAQGRASLLERQATSGLWCLDPLDGTSNFASGIPFFAVSLALLIERESQLGLVYDPVRDECFTAQRGAGAWLNGKQLKGEVEPRRTLKRCIACVDFKRLDRGLAARLGGEPPYGSQRNFGASSLEWCWLADGRFHLYLHGGQKLWDFAAGSLILQESGGVATDLHGEPVFRLGLEPRSVVAVREAAIMPAWREWIRSNQ